MTIDESERQIRVTMDNVIKALDIANMSLKKAIELIEGQNKKPRIELVVNNK